MEIACGLLMLVVFKIVLVRYDLRLDGLWCGTAGLLTIYPEHGQWSLHLIPSPKHWQLGYTRQWEKHVCLYIDSFGCGPLFVFYEFTE